MKVIFRCDASIQIGTGHVMRCLTLADALTTKGTECYFVCRKHEGHLLEVIKQRGHQAYDLPFENYEEDSCENGTKLSHATWLGATQQEDAQQCVDIIKLIQPDWLIVDHYAIDIVWEKTLRPYCKKIMVIDDLADRRHDCDILLDQNYGRHEKDYKDLVSYNCLLLCGPKYSLLRPEFSEWREYSLKRRSHGKLNHVLINLGGVDKDNVTTQIIKSLKYCSLPDSCRITVVMGSTAPWINLVRKEALNLPWITEVKSGIYNMAELMANSDLAIGAAGSTSWERCCLGVPSILLCIAENQKSVINSLEKNGIIVSLSLQDINSNYSDGLDSKINLITYKLMDFVKLSAQVTDGRGCNLVIEKIRRFA